MPRQGLPGLTAAKVQQKNELTKYFGKKVQILYEKTKNKVQSEAMRFQPLHFTLYTLHHTLNKVQSEAM